MPAEHYLPPGEKAELENEVSVCDGDVEVARNSGDQQQLLTKLERGLYLRRRLHGEASAEVAGACRRLCEVCNCTATSMLQQGNMKAAHSLLKRAEEVSEKSDLDRAITWNNLACYYRKAGKLRTAVSFLERALRIEEHVRNADAAQTHLNLCATLSQLQRHVDALYHAQSALIRIYEILAPLMLAGKLNLEGAGSPGEPQFEQVTVLCIAYHNLAVEHEYLKNHEAAICAYAEGLRYASGFLGNDHQLVAIMRDSVESLKAKLPANSSAVKRATELCNDGWGPLKVNQTPKAGTKGSVGNRSAGAGSAAMAAMTPRDSMPGSAVASPQAGDAGGGSRMTNTASYTDVDDGDVSTGSLDLDDEN